MMGVELTRKQLTAQNYKSKSIISVNEKGELINILCGSSVNFINTPLQFPPLSLKLLITNKGV